MRQRDVLAAAAALLRHARLRVIDQRMAHGQRGRAQEMGFIDEAARLSEAQVRLVHQRRRLQSMAGAHSRARALRYAPQLLVKGGQQFGGDAPHVGGGRARLQPVNASSGSGWASSIAPILDVTQRHGSAVFPRFDCRHDSGRHGGFERRFWFS